MKKQAKKTLSSTGWWIASYIERAVLSDVSSDSDSSRCTAWENTIILKARNAESAYKKAIRMASSNKSTFSDPSGKKMGRWVFMGLTSLLPIYDELKDGAEILWIDHSGRTFKKLREMIKSKNKLEAFNSD